MHATLLLLSIFHFNLLLLYIPTCDSSIQPHLVPLLDSVLKREGETVQQGPNNKQPLSAKLEVLLPAPSLPQKWHVIAANGLLRLSVLTLVCLMNAGRHQKRPSQSNEGAQN